MRAKRWLVVAVGVGIGLLAAYALLTGSSKAPRQPSVVSSTSAREPPLGEIRESSRAQLLEILRQADQEDESSP